MPRMPFLIMGVLGIISGSLVLFLPETAKVELPDTVEEGEMFGKDQKFFYMPMFEKDTMTAKEEVK